MRTWCDYGKGHQGAQGGSSPAGPGGRLRVASSNKSWSSRILKRKCVKREVCFATDVPGSVARTGCTSLFCKHVQAPNVLYPKNLPTEKRTKDTESQEIIFVGANDLLICVSRPLLHLDFLASLYFSVNSSPWIRNP